VVQTLSWMSAALGQVSIRGEKNARETLLHAQSPSKARVGHAARRPAPKCVADINGNVCATRGLTGNISKWLDGASLVAFDTTRFGGLIFRGSWAIFSRSHGRVTP